MPDIIEKASWPGDVKVGHIKDCRIFFWSFFSIILYSFSTNLACISSPNVNISLPNEQCFEYSNQDNYDKIQRS